MSLAETNKYLHTAQQRATAVQRNARASSIIAGASKRALEDAYGTSQQKSSATPSAQRSASEKKSPRHS
jgi:hypothetical protein